jgi:hypothetical protein
MEDSVNLLPLVIAAVVLVAVIISARAKAALLSLQDRLEGYQWRNRAPLGFRRDGRPIYAIGGGSVTNFIPTIWSGALLMWLRKNLVFAQPGVVYRDYEGEIAARGDKVKIGMIGPVTVKTYVRNTDIDDAENVDIDDQTLEITEEDYFHFQVDDVDARQTGLALVGAAMERAAYALADETDQFIAAEMISAGTLVDTVPTVASEAYERLVKLGISLDKANIPTPGRFAVVPPEFHGLIRLDDRFVKYESEGDVKVQALLNGAIGQAAGFSILKSNNTSGYVIAGSNISASFADQISKVEAYRIPKRFADAVKGLHVYGAKVTRPEGIVYLAPGS